MSTTTSPLTPAAPKADLSPATLLRAAFALAILCVLILVMGEGLARSMYYPEPTSTAYKIWRADDGSLPYWQGCGPVSIELVRGGPSGTLKGLRAAAREISAAGTNMRVVRSPLSARQWLASPPADPTRVLAVALPLRQGTKLGVLSKASGGTATRASANGPIEAGATVAFATESLGRLRSERGPLSKHSLYLHELGHLAGLDHVRDGQSVMGQRVFEQWRLTPGDRRGLARVERARGCR